jgi:formamidopyrimidine-DNA glycosylase
MPELPEVELVVRGLRPQVQGRTFTHVSFDWPRQIVTPSPRAFARRLPGQRIDRLWRRGKYLVFTLTRDTLLIHLKMTGRLYTTHDGVEPDKWAHVVFDLDDGHQLVFSDARKFGRLHLMADPSPVLDRLGPEPLDAALTAADFEARLGKRRGTLKPLLLNQAFLAGVGNIYADEALWGAQIDPRRKANTLGGSEIGRLYNAIRQVLGDGIEHEGATINWYRKPDGTPGESQEYFAVYDREGEPCSRCGGSITKITLGQRGTHFCPGCQR